MNMSTNAMGMQYYIIYYWQMQHSV